MFEKVPYGVKVRIRGDEVGGFKAQLCIAYNRFLPFVNIWSEIGSYDKTGTKYVFTTFEEARTAAMNEYNRWIEYYQEDEANNKKLKTVSNKTIWEHP